MTLFTFMPEANMHTWLIRHRLPYHVHNELNLNLNSTTTAAIAPTSRMLDLISCTLVIRISIAEPAY